MMHYRKGENIEEELSKDNLPFENLPKDFLWMHVKGGTKVFNVIDYAKKALDESKYRTIVWSGYGGGVVKTISCAEILKRSYPLNQVTRLTYTGMEEHWLPQMEGLDEIVVNRQVPCVHIMLTLDEVDENTNGFQKAGQKTPFWAENSEKDNESPSGSQPGGSHGKRKGGNKQGKDAKRNQNKAQHKQAHKGEKQQSKQNRGAKQSS